MSKTEQEALTRECNALEDTLLPRLREVVACGIKRGRDRYWEFALPPVKNLSLAFIMIRTLYIAGILPWGHHSLHATISGISATKETYIMLLLLELLHVRSKRIKQALLGKGAWGSKGRGGIYLKAAHSLEYGATHAHEMRTLELPATIEEFFKLCLTMNRLIHLLCATSRDEKDLLQIVCTKVRHLLQQHDLPFEIWEKPSMSPDLWQRYVDQFDSLHIAALQIAHEHLGLPQV